MEYNLTLSSAPHVRSPITVRFLMAQVLIALLPAIGVSLWVFGLEAGLVIAVTVASCVISEYICTKLARRRTTVGDLSAVVTGVLLAFNLPPSVPLWLPVVGGAFAIVIVKFLFGGIGQNIVNPALAARAAMLASWPALMTNFTLDGVSKATPLGMMHGGATYTAANMPGLWQLLTGQISGCLGETSALALLIGGIYLIYRKVISWRIPVIYLATVAILTTVLGRHGAGWFTGNGIFEILAGGMMLGAFFMATDYATCPITEQAQVIYALGCGLLTTVIRLYGGYAEGVSYSILIMNLVTPLLDRAFQPKIFGAAKKAKVAK